MGGTFEIKLNSLFLKSRNSVYYVCSSQIIVIWFQAEQTLKANPGRQSLGVAKQASVHFLPSPRWLILPQKSRTKGKRLLHPKTSKWLFWLGVIFSNLARTENFLLCSEQMETLGPEQQTQMQSVSSDQIPEPAGCGSEQAMPFSHHCECLHRNRRILFFTCTFSLQMLI